jgi:hypothetical protein
MVFLKDKNVYGFYEVNLPIKNEKVIGIFISGHVFNRCVFLHRVLCIHHLTYDWVRNELTVERQNEIL